jgi:hypothetical protein
VEHNALMARMKVLEAELLAVKAVADKALSTANKPKKPA